MFSMQEIGKRILNLRKQNNMTQMELADKIGISYQAVSSWERGNSMPDIAKIPELAALFHISIDELIGESRVIKSVLNHPDGEVKAEDFAEEELKEALPIMKPNQISHIISESDLSKLKDIELFLPYMSEDDVKEFAMGAQAEGKDIAVFLPYLREEDVKELAMKAYAAGNDTAVFLPFIEEEDVKEIAMKAQAEGNDTAIYLPFIEEEDVKELAMKAYAAGDDIAVYLPFMREGDVKDILFAYMKK